MAIKLSSTFLLRKLHQLTGIAPLGIFFFVHMFTNSKAMNGEASFEKAVQDIHDIPFLLFLEIFGIFIPLIFHSVYGVIISSEGRPNVTAYITQKLVLSFSSEYGYLPILFLILSYSEL